MNKFKKVFSVVKETTENFIKDGGALPPQKNFLVKEEERISDDFVIVREVFELGCPNCGAPIGHKLVVDERDGGAAMDINYLESSTLMVMCPWCKNQKLKLSF